MTGPIAIYNSEFSSRDGPFPGTELLRRWTRLHLRTFSDF
jgi:hypothetical protein